MTAKNTDDQQVHLFDGRVWISERLKRRITMRRHRDGLEGSWRCVSESEYKLYRGDEPILVTDWKGEALPIVVPDIASAWRRCCSILYYIVATDEYRSRLDQSMTQLVLWSQGHQGLTGRSSGIVGELGEFYAVKTLGLARATEREKGFDAWDHDGSRIEIKCRQVGAEDVGKGLEECSPLRLRSDTEWDRLVLVLIDTQFRLRSIHRVHRDDVHHRWPSTNTRTRGNLSIAVRSFAREANEVFGPKQYQFLSKVDRAWRHKLPQGEMCPAMPHEIGQPSAHLRCT